jgi:hypothetical protein
MAAIDTASAILGLVTLLAPIAILSVALYLVLRLAAAGDLKRGVLYIVFLPERQRVLVRWFVIMALFFIAGTVLDGLSLLAIIPGYVDALAGAIADIGAAAALLLLLDRGLRPSPLSESERANLNAHPLLLAALGIGDE